jgi:Uma2 family endonuclease
MDEITDQPGLRIAYNEGDLEIMTVSYAHEFYNRSISDLIRIISLETEIDVINAGSTTLKGKRAKSVAKPDTCFYRDA